MHKNYDILFQIEESDDMEVASGAPTQFATLGKYSPAPSMASYSSSEASNFQPNIPVAHENMQMCSYSHAAMEYY